ncbi:hypothetical protein DRQ00_02780 [candidate division KSB1 bacterium]|nr:MAG: hypothetical protein DRQ00_02780 [candidate division KSB1 bacterium]
MCNRSALKKISCHSLRHSFATHLLPACALHADREAGVDLIELQKILGHVSVLTTSKYTQGRQGINLSWQISIQGRYPGKRHSEMRKRNGYLQIS